MFLKLLLHRMLQWKWMLIIPAVTAPSISLMMLLFVEPSYISTCRLWVKERAESSDLLKIQRLGPQQNTYVEVQNEIILSNPVLDDVVKRRSMTTPAPKQSIWSRLTGLGNDGADLNDIDAVNDLRGRVWVLVSNPEIIEVGCKMNTPELAQETLAELVSAYRRQYLSILNVEVNEYKHFLKEELQKLLQTVDDLEAQVKAFDSQHPDVASAPIVGGDATVTGAPSIGISRNMGEVSPVPMILEALAKLELELNQARIRFAPGSDRVQLLNQQIEETETLLADYMAELSENARLAVENEALKWRLLEARRQYTSINTEYHRILITEGTKLKQTSSITQLNRPTYNPEQISPRKKATLISSGVLGLFFGVALFYIRFLMDHTYCLAEEAGQDLDLPVFAVIPQDPAPPARGIDRLILGTFKLIGRLNPFRKKSV